VSQRTLTVFQTNTGAVEEIEILRAGGPRANYYAGFYGLQRARSLFLAFAERAAASLGQLLSGVHA
jgi:hypothetical protein